VDAAEPPRIVFESPALCRESDRAEDVLRRAIVPGLAPGPGWVVSMRMERADGRAVRAQGEILDADGMQVAQRTIAATSTECAGLARAVGVWASLVLDSELHRARAAALAAQPDAHVTRGVAAGRLAALAVGEPAPSASDEPARADGAASASGEPPAGRDEPAGGWPAPADAEQASPEHDWYLHHDSGGRAFEVGFGVFLMTGPGGGALAGPAAFTVIEAGHGVFLRPSVAYGESLTSLPPSDVKRSTWGAARFDTCLRLPGLYTRHQGMQLDACAGTDVGYTTIEANGGTTLPYLDLGPSIDLRGELGSSLSAVLRVVAGINVLRGTFTDLSGTQERAPLAGGRLELAFSWDVR
jgi:hypothetical protein